MPTKLPKLERVYQNHHLDSTRWDRYTVRDGDIIIATPYILKPVARNEIARPDDNFNAVNDGAGFFLGRVNRVYGRMETELPPGRYHGVVGFIYK